MIGWENVQGAYFIHKLEDDISALETADGNIQSEIGKLSDLTTVSKTNAVSAINELNGKNKLVTSFSGKSDGSASKGIELVGYSRALVITAGATSDRIGIWIMACGTTGSMSIKRIDDATGSKISITAGADPFKAIVAYSGTNTYEISVYAFVFAGNVIETVEGA